MALRVRVRGPLTSGSGVRRTVLAEFASANRTARQTLVTAASGYVRRASGAYERGWRNRPTRYGALVIVHDVAENPLVHASVHETGRAREKGGPGGRESIKNWIKLRGLVPRGGTSEKDYDRFAAGIAWKLYLQGWPNLGSFRGGYYPGRAPAPMDRAMETQAVPIRYAYEHAAARIARRLG